MIGLAANYQKLRHYWRASECLQSALAIAETESYRCLRATILSECLTLAVFSASRRQISTWLTHLDTCPDLVLLQGERRCRYFQSLGLAYTIREDYPQAVTALEQGLAYAQQIGNRCLELNFVNNIGVVYGYRLQNYSRASQFFQTAVLLARELAKFSETAIILSSLAYCYTKLHQPRLALTAALRAVVIARTVELPDAMGMALAGLASVYWHQGYYGHCFPLIVRALWILQPWRSMNGRFVWDAFYELVSHKLHLIRTLLQGVFHAQSRNRQSIEFCQPSPKLCQSEQGNAEIVKPTK